MPAHISAVVSVLEKLYDVVEVWTGICSHSLSWCSVGHYLVCIMLLACRGWLRYPTETQPGHLD